jgi:hypothetical protein
MSVGNIGRVRTSLLKHDFASNPNIAGNAPVFTFCGNRDLLWRFLIQASQDEVEGCFQKCDRLF